MNEYGVEVPDDEDRLLTHAEWNALGPSGQYVVMSNLHRRLARAKRRILAHSGLVWLVRIAVLVVLIRFLWT